MVLSHYPSDRRFWLQTDGSKIGISGVLFQIDGEGNELIIAVVSRVLTAYGKNYTITEIDLMAIIYLLVKLRTYLLGQTFHIVTDHQALTFLMKANYYSSRLMRWFLLLQHHSYDIVHCKGKDNIIADYFSRVSPNGVDFDLADGPMNSNLTIREPTEYSVR